MHKGSTLRQRSLVPPCYLAWLAGEPDLALSRAAASQEADDGDILAHEA